MAYSTPPPKRSGAALSASTEPLNVSFGEFDRSQATIERLDLSDLDADYAANPRYVLVLHGVLNREECTDLIALSEQREYEVALVNTGGGRQRSMVEIRNNDRAIVDSHRIAMQIWRRIAAVLPPETEAQLHHRTTPNKDRVAQPSEAGTSVVTESSTSWAAVGLNERLRFLRYDPGTFFAAHHDGSYIRDDPAHPQYGT